MDNSDYIAVLALIISTLSLISSIWLAKRDEAKIKTEIKLFPFHPDYDQTKLLIKAMNIGRRPIILTSYGGNLADGSWCNINIGEVVINRNSNGGVRLGENETYEKYLYQDDMYVQMPDRNSEFVSLWFEDTVGRRYNLTNSKKLVERLKISEINS
jgi:hypothetical protein